MIPARLSLGVAQTVGGKAALLVRLAPPAQAALLVRLAQAALLAQAVLPVRLAPAALPQVNVPLSVIGTALCTPHVKTRVKAGVGKTTKAA